MGLFNFTKKKKPQRMEVCLSLNCKDFDEVIREFLEYKDYCQVVEWCVDKTDGVEYYSKDEFVAKLKILKEMSKGKKIIIDYKGDDIIKERILSWSMGLADIIDVAYSDKNLNSYIRSARKKKTKVLVSYEDYEGMLDREKVATQYLLMEKTGADILKIACMAKEEKDTYAILEGASAYSSLNGHKDIVAIAMGEEGQVSRICAGDFGSIMTYACGKSQTAPGQFDAMKLSKYLDRYYNREGK